MMKIIEVGIRGVAFAVFLFPVVISIALGSYVMAEVLNEPDRELNILPFEFPDKSTFTSTGGIGFVSLQSEYSSGEPINISISVTDLFFDCGDLYITLYDLDIDQSLSQNAYFGQCFDSDTLLPVDDEFSETISKTGNYQIIVEMNDEQSTKTIRATAKFTVN